MIRKILGWTGAALLVFVLGFDDDLRAIYRYLRSVPPVPYDPGPSVRRKGDAAQVVCSSPAPEGTNGFSSAVGP
jgi:hypothetical protein